MKNIYDRLQSLKKQRVYLFGAGDCGLYARHMLEERFKVAVSGFIDSFRHGTLDGLPIILAKEFLAENASDRTVLITSQYWREIEETLRSHGHVNHDLLIHAPMSWRNLNQFRAKLAPVVPARDMETHPLATVPNAGAAQAAAPVSAPDALTELLTIPFNGECHVDLPLTERCNLRCGYCPHHDTSRKSWNETAPWLVDRVHALLTAHPGVRIELGGGAGETTILKTWQQHAERFMATGSQMRMTTNLARELRWDEAETLSRFFHLSVSLDSVDSQILKSIRVGASPSKIVFNIAQIRAAAAVEGREPPNFNIQAVVTDKSVALVDRVAAMAVALGIKNVRYIALNGRMYDPTLSGIAGLDRNRALEAVAAFERAFEIGINADISVDVDDEVSNCLAACLSQPTSSEEVATPVGIPDVPAPQGKIPADGCPPGTTRLCLEPWTHVIFTYDGTVFSCCYGAPMFRPDYAAIGTDMDAIFNAEPIRDLRRQLLTGDLGALCRNCVQKPVVAIGEFQEKVDTLVRVRRLRRGIERPDR